MKRFGRFELRALLHKSLRSMLWVVFDPQSGQEMFLMMPREKPNSEAAMLHWLKTVDGASRIHHPNLAHVIETGRVDPWPYVAYDRALGETLEERIARGAPPLPLDAAGWAAQALEGLAFAHEAGHAHRDIQLAHIVVDGANHVRVLGLEVAQEVVPPNVDFNTTTRRAVREAAEEDVVCIGLLLHRLLSGRPVLEESDLQVVLQRMQPQGHDLVRLGWETPYAIPEPLRAIVNRASDRQTRQRYHLARSFWRALDGWRLSAEQDDGGPIALLKDKMQRFGHLPSTSTRLVTTVSSSAMAGQHGSQLASMALKDMALALELIRRVNNALRQQGPTSGGTVLNLQRAIAMLGLNGLEDAARALKPWPGPMNEGQAQFMQSVMRRVHRAGQVAQALRPAGYDGEVIYLISLMQNLGRLLVQYHFPDDAQQIRQLQVAPEATEDNPNPRGMNEQSAAYAVLGCDLESLGLAVAKYWGLGDELQHMMRRQPQEAPVRHADGDTEMLRLTCSLANELVDALALPERKRQAAIELATRRYARALGLGLREIYDALGASGAIADAGESGLGAMSDPAVGAAATAAPRSRLRERAESGVPAPAANTATNTATNTAINNTNSTAQPGSPTGTRPSGAPEPGKDRP
ncbi:serine/threonine protein kinase [Roseateles chitinivorans]|uniref:serine/threonine protein kinase n=1 Tax=Roseateles chitinivorans TaxID=2917965 RepID=UPI003D66F75A